MKLYYTIITKYYYIINFDYILYEAWNNILRDDTTKINLELLSKVQSKRALIWKCNYYQYIAIQMFYQALMAEWFV